MHINRHIIIISEGCVGFIMICGSAIFTTVSTMETLRQRGTTMDTHRTIKELERPSVRIIRVLK